MVPMRDGVTLAVDVFRPHGECAYPALVAMSPYGKDIQSLPRPPQPVTAPLFGQTRSIEAGDPPFLVSHGYALVVADLRGTGKSGGDYRGWMSKQEAEDGYDLIEWVAAQPWCDGNVGMSGISYFGTIQLSVAAEQPPHLKAIMPWNAPADFYRESTHHGGILQVFFDMLYSRYISGGVSVMAEDKTSDELRNLIEVAKAAQPELELYSTFYHILENPRVSPCWFDVLANPLDGPYYWERSACRLYDRIKVPFYASSGWWAFAHMHLVGAFRNYDGIDAPKKLLIDRRADMDSPLPDWYNEEVVRWYDYWLKGVDTGIMDEPPIRLFVMGKNEWRTEHEWPLARTRWSKLYLRRWEGLSPEPEPVPGRPDHFVQQPPDETATVQGVRYLTSPLGDAMEITGPLALYLWASIDQDDTNWLVSLRDVAPDGRISDIARGFLKASHRALDPGLSQPWEPYHPHEACVPVPPDEPVEYAIALSPTAYVLAPGHQVELVVNCMDHPRHPVAPPTVGQIHMPYHICSHRTTLHRIFHDEEHPSHLLLPVIPATAAHAAARDDRI